MPYATFPTPPGWELGLCCQSAILIPPLSWGWHKRASLCRYGNRTRDRLNWPLLASAGTWGGQEEGVFRGRGGHYQEGVGRQGAGAGAVLFSPLISLSLSHTHTKQSGGSFFNPTLLLLALSLCGEATLGYHCGHGKPKWPTLTIHNHPGYSHETGLGSL